MPVQVGRTLGAVNGRLLATAGIIAAMLLAGCAPTSAPDQPYVPDPDPRTHWVLRHRVVDATGLRVTGQQISHHEESSSVAVAAQGGAPAGDCSVSVAEPGVGGPDNKVGDKITTTFDGRPAVRNGVGAESDYLMWQLEDTSWVDVGCFAPGSRANVDRVAAAVELEPATLRVPVSLETPRGYRVSSIDVDLAGAGARVYLDPDHPTSGPAGLAIMVDSPDRATTPSGEQQTYGGRPGRRHSDEFGATVWVQEQGRWVYVGTAPDDTGPYPDRSDEIPVLETIASSLSFPKDLGSPRTWFSAENVFG